MQWEIIGHEWAVDLLQRHIQRGETRHAYLFSGPPGVGRRTLALRFAQALNCTNPPSPGQYCGTCRACKQTAARQHPDLSVIQPEQRGAQLSVEMVRDLQRSLALAPYEARFRVALLPDFQNATPSAQNALLKTLEEAPERAVLLLTADAAENLLPTIVSRCEVMRLRPLPVESLRANLAARGSDPARAELLAHLSGGRAGYAVQMAASDELFERRCARLDELWDLLHQNRRERFAYAETKTRAKSNTREEREKVREDLRGTFVEWISFWRDVMLRSAGSSAPLTNPDQVERADQLALAADLPGARRQVQALEEALARVNNANLLLLTETLLLGFPRLR